LASTLAALAQSDEVRVSAHPYVPPRVRFETQSQLVPIEVVVRDRQGQPVGGLKRQDFEVQDEGKPQEIVAFAEKDHTVAPAQGGAVATQRSLVLFVDDRHGDIGHLRSVQVAAKRYLKTALTPDIQVAIYTASGSLLHGFTHDRAALAAALDRLSLRPRINEHASPSPYESYLIANNLMPAPLKKGAGMDSGMSAQSAKEALARSTWEQVRLDARNTLDSINGAMALLGEAPGTRVLLLASTGFLAQTLWEEQDSLIRRALRQDITINALDAKGVWTTTGDFAGGRERWPGAGGARGASAFQDQAAKEEGNSILAEAASATGGTFFRGNNDLAEGMARLGGIPSVSYLLAIRPAEPEKEGCYRKLKVRVAGEARSAVQARRGYYVPTKTPPAPPRALDRLAASDEVLTAFPIEVETGTAAGNGVINVQLKVHVDIGKLVFARHGDRHIQELTVLGVLVNAGGEVVSGKEGKIEFELAADSLAKIRASGFNAFLSLPVDAGTYRLRVVVQDAQGQMAALARPLEVPER
jgi:VWFA-related protein